MMIDGRRKLLLNQAEFRSLRLLSAVSSTQNAQKVRAVAANLV
jgi:hypothetical protein